MQGELQRQVPAVPRRFWFRGRPCDHAVMAFRVAQHLVRLWIHILRQLEDGFLEEFQVIGWTRFLRSILVLLFSHVAAHVVDHGSGMFCIGFCWYLRTSRCAPDDCSLTERRSVHSDASPAGHFFRGNLDFISMSPLYFAVFSAVGTLRQVIFWEPSTTKSSSLSRSRGGGGVARSLLPGDLPPISLSDSLHRSRHRVTIPHGVFVKSRQKQQQQPQQQQHSPDG